MESYRSKFERLMAQDAERCGSRVVFGDPVSEADIASLELHFGGQLPQDLCELYLEFNGVGHQAPGEGVSWFLVPIDEIPALSRGVEELLDLHPRVCFFGDYGNGDSYGYVRPEDGPFLESTLHMWEHETGTLHDSGGTFAEFVDAMVRSMEEEEGA